MVGAARFLYPSCLNLVAYLHVKDKMEDAKNLKGYIFLQYTDFLISLPMISSWQLNQTRSNIRRQNDKYEKYESLSICVKHILCKKNLTAYGILLPNFVDKAEYWKRKEN